MDKLEQWNRIGINRGKVIKMRGRFPKKRFIAFNLTIIVLLVVILGTQFYTMHLVRSMLQQKTTGVTVTFSDCLRAILPRRILSLFLPRTMNNGPVRSPLDDIIDNDRQRLLPFLESSWRSSYAKNGSVFNYLDSYRNPCWMEEMPHETKLKYDGNRFLEFFMSYDKSNQYKAVGEALLGEKALLRGRRLTSERNWRFRCLPSFYIIGVHKSGTTDFFDALIRHPFIATPIIKESNFWLRSMEVGMTFEDYLELYDPVAEMIRKNKHMITLDASPENFFLWNHTEYRDTDPPENPRFIANELRALDPSTKIILMLRNPVTWLYSLYGHERKDSQSPEEFDECVRNATFEFDLCLQEKTVRQCAIVVMKKQPCPVAHMIYHIYLEEWLKLFPRGQILIIRSEDYFSNRLRVLREVYRFLGVPALSPDQEQYVTYQDVRNKGRRTEPMWESTRQHLINFSRPYNDRLAHLLRDDKFFWKDENNLIQNL